MNPPCLRTRILGALRLQPMTDRELATCLCADTRHVAQTRQRMLKRQLVRVCGYGPRIRKVGQIPHRYTLV